MSTSSEGSPSELELFILDALQKWSLTPEEARDIVEKLQTLGLVEPDIRAYVSERSADFKWRSDPPSKPQVLRYITARQDLIDRGYLQPLESTRRRRERKQSPESDTQESPTSNDADQTSEPPISDDDKLAEHVLSSEVDPERREGEMQTFVEKCREYIRDGAVDEYIEGVFLFDGIEDGVVQFQTDYPFRAQNALRRYRSDLEEIAQKIWPQVEGVTCLFQGDPVEG